MQYVSTRGKVDSLPFADALLTGLAPDGGLFMPQSWPQLGRDQISDLATLPYADIACEIMYPFVSGDIEKPVFLQICRDAYATFSHRAIAPLTQSDQETWVMELFHGPTLAFKDIALQLLGRLFTHILHERQDRLCIVGATSGDTGGAAIEALRGLDRIDVFILHPEGRISDVQRRMMTCADATNIHNIAIKGSFDDCQRLVKDMFAHEAFRRTLRLGAINSINWARIMAQIVYYFTAAISLGAPDRAVSFVVPTGNFGDIFAGFAAMKMGLPINRLCIASNQNDILDRALRSGEYRPAGVVQTSSPSMDIQVSSNFERLLFEATDRDPRATKAMMASLKQSGGFEIPAPALSAITRVFASARADEPDSKNMIKEVFKKTGMIIDPHTSVGFVAADQLRIEKRLSGTAVILATAHPAKFPEAVKDACGIYPELPNSHDGLFERPEHFSSLAADQSGIESFIRERARVLSS